MSPKTRLHTDFPPAAPIVPEPVKLFLRHLANSGKAKGTLRSYKDTLILFLGYFDNQEPASISTDMLDEFFEDLRKKRSPATVNMMKSAVRSFYQYLLDGEKVAKDPSRRIKNEKFVRKSPGIFSAEQLRNFLQVMTDAIGSPPQPGPMRDFIMFQMAYNTGLRVGELVSINIEDVDAKRTLEIIGKGKKLDSIPLNAVIRAELRHYLAWRKNVKAKDRKALFLNRMGGGFRRGATSFN